MLHWKPHQQIHNGLLVGRVCWPGSIAEWTLWWNLNRRLHPCIMMKDGSDKGFPTKAGSSFSSRIVAWRSWALITRAKQECRAGGLIWSVFISRRFLEMEAACPHSLSPKSIPFFAQPWEGTFVLLRNISVMPECPHTLIYIHTPLRALLNLPVLTLKLGRKQVLKAAILCHFSWSGIFHLKVYI